MKQTAALTDIESLRRQVGALLAGATQTTAPRLALGVPPADAVLGGGLAPHGLHEAFGAAAPAFALGLAGRMPAPIVWVAGQDRDGLLYPCGLADFGVQAADLIVVSAPPREAAWAFEQALRSGVAGAVVAEVRDLPDFKHSRRLQLAAREGGTLGLMLTGNGNRKRQPTSAAETRWRVDFAPSPALNAPPRYGLNLVKNKSGSLGEWEVDWHAPTHRFHLAAAG